MNHYIFPKPDEPTCTECGSAVEWIRSRTYEHGSFTMRELSTTQVYFCMECGNIDVAREYESVSPVKCGGCESCVPSVRPV